MPLLRFDHDDPDWWGADPLERMRRDDAMVSVEYDAQDGLRTASGRLRMATEHCLLVEMLDESGVGSATWISRERIVAVSCAFVVEHPQRSTDVA